MAFTRKRRTKAFNVTFHDGKESKTKLMKLGDSIDAKSSSTQSLETLEDKDIYSGNIDDGKNCSIPWNEVPSSHEVNERAAVKAWATVREELRIACVEGEAMPLNQMCVLCSIDKASFRCRQCGPHAYYCQTCLSRLHDTICVFHKPEEWKDGLFHNVELRIKIESRNHCCSPKKTTDLSVIDIDGVPHQTSFEYCMCEPLVVTMARFQLWPSSPTQPQIAYTFDLLDWCEVLLLECQVPLKDFCAALSFKCQELNYKVCNKNRKIDFNNQKTYFVVRDHLYNTLIDSFEEYRYIKHELRTLSFYCSSLDRGNICPACPKVGGKKIVSIDAIFGLPRRMKAGASFRNSLHGQIFFGEQSEVDTFVNTSISGCKIEDCSDFKAGTALRSSSRFHALDETAVLGAGCRHEFPLTFVNLKHGEKYSYAVWIIENILSKHISSSTEFHLMYDIACNLKRYLTNTGRNDILNRIVSFTVPAFHAYGHSVSCQLDYSPLRTDGIGLSDGEVMERLWSFLRRFGRMTKEMRPSHRIDVLTHALLYYCIKKTEKLSHLLSLRWKRAETTNKTALKNCTDYLSSDFNAGDKLISDHEDIIQQWMKEEKAILTSSNDDKREALRSLFAKKTFLLQLKKKYADGQKIALKLSKLINNECKKIKVILTEIGEPAEATVSFDTLSDNCLPYSNHKQSSIIYNYLILKRSQEEMALLEEDMKNTLNHFKAKIDLLNQCLITISNNDCQTLYNQGIYSFLYKSKEKVYIQYQTAIKRFSLCIKLPESHLIRGTCDHDNIIDSETPLNIESDSEYDSDDYD